MFVTLRMTTYPFFQGAVPNLIQLLQTLSQLEALSHSCWLNRYRAQPEGAPSFSKTNHNTKTRKKAPFKHSPFMISPEPHFWNKNSGCYTFFVTLWPLKLDSGFLGLHAEECAMATGYPVPLWATSACLWLLLWLMTRNIWYYGC